MHAMLTLDKGRCGVSNLRLFRAFLLSSSGLKNSKDLMISTPSGFKSPFECKRLW